MFVFFVTIDEYLGAMGATSREHAYTGASVLGCSAKAQKGNFSREELHTEDRFPIVGGVGPWHALASKTPRSPETKRKYRFEAESMWC